jgi:hypothetical protein
MENIPNYQNFAGFHSLYLKRILPSTSVATGAPLDRRCLARAQTRLFRRAVLLCRTASYARSHETQLPIAVCWLQRPWLAIAIPDRNQLLMLLLMVDD